MPWARALAAACFVAGTAALRLARGSPEVHWGHGGEAPGFEVAPHGNLPFDQQKKQHVTEEACSYGPESGTKHIIWKQWGDDDEEGRERAMSDGYHFMENFAGNPSHDVLNSISFFVDAAAGAQDVGERKRAAEQGRNISRSMEKKLLKKYEDGTFGQLMGLRKDLMDSLQVLLYEQQLGIQAEGSELVKSAAAAYKKCGNCFTRGRPIKAGEEEDAALESYIVDEARFRFGKDKFAAKVHPKSIYPKLEARVVANEKKFDRQTAMLIVGMGSMASGFGRYALQEGDLEPAKRWVKLHFASAMETKDVEVVADLVGFLKLYGCTEGKDALVMEGTRWLIANQKEDGRWGDRTSESVSNVAEAYDVLDHVWAPFSALRDGPQMGNTSDPYYMHIRQAIDAADKVGVKSVQQQIQ